MGGITRREFLKGTGGAIAGVAVPGAAAGAAAAAGAERAADDTPVTATADARNVVLDVNGVRRAVRVEPRTTLAEALRGGLDLTGTKIGCGRGACSACTVWLDGAPVASCMLLAVDVGERRIVTIEGLARGTELHPVQTAFIARDAVQCGFCTPGLVMSCAALLERNPNPSVEDVHAAIDGHLCRCGTYSHVIEALLDAAKVVKG